ncbi:MAG: NAD(P)-binding domain-containing protein [Candidatus Heimdallarchaeota archaeon]|nr:MAG: NAD(P)-binding domain-containing protein [Candidatus Heimdallarchaeota archaeon]
MSTQIYFTQDGEVSNLQEKTVAIIGYGNQARAQALNLRDSGIKVILGLEKEKYKQRAQKDDFPIFNIPKAVEHSDFILLLVSDEDMVRIVSETINPSLKENQTIVFASGYTVAFNLVTLPEKNDVLLLSPRVPGIAIRESFIQNKGFFSFIGIHQDFSGNAKQNLLALTKAIGGLTDTRPAIEVTFKHQAVLSLFASQTFSYALTQVLLRSILRLIEDGYPPEAIFVELILSGEGRFTVDKIIDVGMIKQMNYHSQTSQYGQMSRGVKFRGVAKKVEEIQRVILHEIENGQFVKEWETFESKLKLQIMRYFEGNTKFAALEQQVRDNLNFKKLSIEKEPDFPPDDKINQYPQLKKEIDNIRAFYDGL